MDTQIEQLNLSSITKFALAYAGITTVSELKEYNYIFFFSKIFFLVIVLQSHYERAKSHTLHISS